MKADVTMTSSIDVPEKLRKIRDPAFQTFAAQTWHKLYYPFCPRSTGLLFDTVDIKPFAITHLMPYASEVYNHNRNYRKDKAPKASSHWDKAAEPSEKPKLIASMQRYVDSGRLNLNGK